MQAVLRPKSVKPSRDEDNSLLMCYVVPSFHFEIESAALFLFQYTQGPGLLGVFFARPYSTTRTVNLPFRSARTPTLATAVSHQATDEDPLGSLASNPAD